MPDPARISRPPVTGHRPDRPRPEPEIDLTYHQLPGQLPPSSKLASPRKPKGLEETQIPPPAERRGLNDQGRGQGLAWAGTPAQGRGPRLLW